MYNLLGLLNYSNCVEFTWAPKDFQLETGAMCPLRSIYLGSERLPVRDRSRVLYGEFALFLASHCSVLEDNKKLMGFFGTVDRCTDFNWSQLISMGCN